jgi:uracil-DNA glycosylase
MDPTWQTVLSDEFKKPYFKKLLKTLEKEYAQEVIYPPQDIVFNAFNKTPFDKIKVVILGQDPYHGEGQAHGLCFSVPDGMKPPRSLVNIFKELSTDLGAPVPTHGNLESWAKQGILLLNTTLTVKAKQPLSHQNLGWETFTDTVITVLNKQKNGLIFLLWGRNAQIKEELIDTSKHHVLKAAHPSPFSAAHGFFGCKHFSKTNELLKKEGLGSIDWKV